MTSNTLHTNIIHRLARALLALTDRDPGRDPAIVDTDAVLVLLFLAWHAGPRDCLDVPDAAAGLGMRPADLTAAVCRLRDAGLLAVLPLAAPPPPHHPCYLYRFHVAPFHPVAPPAMVDRLRAARDVIDRAFAVPLPAGLGSEPRATLVAVAALSALGTPATVGELAYLTWNPRTPADAPDALAAVGLLTVDRTVWPHRYALADPTTDTDN